MDARPLGTPPPLVLIADVYFIICTISLSSFLSTWWQHPNQNPWIVIPLGILHVAAFVDMFLLLSWAREQSAVAHSGFNTTPFEFVWTVSVTIVFKYLLDSGNNAMSAWLFEVLDFVVRLFGMRTAVLRFNSVVRFLNGPEDAELDFAELPDI